MRQGVTASELPAVLGRFCYQIVQNVSHVISGSIVLVVIHHVSHVQVVPYANTVAVNTVNRVVQDRLPLIRVMPAYNATLARLRATAVHTAKAATHSHTRQEVESASTAPIQR